MTAADDLLGPVHVAPAYAAVLDRLRRSIALAVVLPGEKLPPERALADSMGVSRPTVREALRVLQGEGLIVTRRGGGGGAVVAVRSAPLDDLRRTRAQIDEIFEYRLGVETMAARLAAQRQSPADLRELDRWQAALLASADLGAFRRADSGFHLAVADATRNGMLQRSIRDARAAAFDALDTRPFQPLRESTARGHAAIIAAVRSHDADAAADAMAEHLTTARREVLAVLLDGE
jgi:GntR family transcriptional repressor for pyruvate dehydrogenase complex